MGAACCRPAAADNGNDSGDAIKKHARGNGASVAARRGSRSRDAAAAALTSHAISTSPSLPKADSFASSSGGGGGLAAVSEDDECYFDARSDGEGDASSVGSHEGVGSFRRRAAGGSGREASAAAPGFFAGVAAAVAARLGFGDASPSSSSPPAPAAAAAGTASSASSSPFAFPWFSLRRSGSSQSNLSGGDGGGANASSPFATTPAATTTPRAAGANDRDRHFNSRHSLSLNPRPVAGPGGQPSMELAPGVVVPADVVLQPEPPLKSGGDHGNGVVVPGACMPLLSLARESLGARGIIGIGGHHHRNSMGGRQRATFVQTVRPNAGDSGLRRAPEYQSESESDDDDEEGEGEGEEEARGGETGTEAASSPSPASKAAAKAAAAKAAAAKAAAAKAAAAKAAAAEGEPRWHRRFDWWSPSTSSPRRRRPRNGGDASPFSTPAPRFLTETYGPCDATTFRVRSKDYLKSKTKQASPEAIYELVAADLYSFDFKISHISKHVVLPPLPSPSRAHAALSPHDRLPPLLILNIQLPTYPASIWGGGGGGGGGGMLGGLFGGGDSDNASASSTADGRGHSLVFYFRLPDNWDPHVYENSHPAAAPALGLARRFVHNGRELDGTPTRDRLKLIARVANPVEWAGAAPLSSAEARLLASYNDKPLLTRPQHKFFHGPGYLEVDLDVHAYAFLARRALTSFLSRLSSVVFDNALVVEGRSGPELPEAVLCCARMARVDFELARPFPATQDPEEAMTAAAAFAAEEAAKQQQREAESGASSATAATTATGGVLRPPLGSAPWRPSTVDENFSPPLESAMSSSISVVLSGVAPGTPRAAAAGAASGAVAASGAAAASASNKRA